MAKRAAAASESRPLDATCRVVVLHGEEIFLRQLYTQSLRADLEKKHGQVDMVQFDGLTAKAADILDECRSFGLIASHKLIIVDNADQAVKEENRALFERYAQGIVDAPDESSATLVLRSGTWRPGNLDKLIAQVGVVIKCEALPEEKAIAWAIARCRKEHGGEIERDAAHLLVMRVGSDLGRIDSELGKLVAAAGHDGNAKPKSIGRELVAQFVGLSREEEVWGIQYTLLSATAPEALHAMHDALEVSRHPPALIFYATNDLARKLHAATHAVRAGMNAWQLKGPLKLWGPSGDALVAAAGKLAPATARALLRETLDATTRDRSGLGESGRTLERTTLAFCRAMATRK